MHALSVGQPYPHKLPESVQYNYRAGAHELLMVFSRPSVPEIADVRQGEAEFGLAVVGDVLFFLYRFGRAVKWSDAPYSIHLVPAAERAAPELAQTPDTRALLSVILIEAGSMIVRALRVVSLSPEFTAALQHRDPRAVRAAVGIRPPTIARSRRPTSATPILPGCSR